MNTRNSIAYLKQAPIDHHFGNTEQIIPKEEQIFDSPFIDGLTVTYLFPDPETKVYKYVNNSNIVEKNLTNNELKETGLKNLVKHVMKNQLKINKYTNGYFTISLDGTFDASLILLNGIWEKSIKSYVAGDVAVAVPSRDILIFCDASSQNGIEEMKKAVKMISLNANYQLSDKILKRSGSTWEYLL